MIFVPSLQTFAPTLTFFFVRNRTSRRPSREALTYSLFLPPPSRSHAFTEEPERAELSRAYLSLHTPYLAWMCGRAAPLRLSSLPLGHKRKGGVGRAEDPTLHSSKMFLNLALCWAPIIALPATATYDIS